jgi:hypothetical protein
MTKSGTAQLDRIFIQGQALTLDFQPLNLANQVKKMSKVKISGV